MKKIVQLIITMVILIVDINTVQVAIHLLPISDTKLKELQKRFDAIVP